MFLFEQKICYGCMLYYYYYYAITASQNAGDCKKKKECKVCRKYIWGICVVISLPDLKKVKRTVRKS